MFVLFLHSVLKSIAESKDLHYKKNVSKTLKPFNVKHFTVYQKKQRQLIYYRGTKSYMQYYIPLS